MLEPMAQEMGKEMLRFHRLYGRKSPGVFVSFTSIACLKRSTCCWLL